MNKKMPKINRRGRGRPKIPTENTGKLSLKEIEEEIDDPTIFEGVLAYAKLQKKYTEKPKDKDMTLKEFEAKLEEFKTQKIYKTTETDVKFSKEDMDDLNEDLLRSINKGDA